jgi:DNA-binding response OmpR family regulator
MFALLDDLDLAAQPCLVLAHPDPVFTTETSRAFRRQGWDVYPATNGPELRRLTRMLGAHLVILDAELPGESGWLTCAKLRLELPEVRVLLIGDDPSIRQQHRANFIGAAGLFTRNAGAALLLRHARDLEPAA